MFMENRDFSTFIHFQNDPITIIQSFHFSKFFHVNIMNCHHAQGTPYTKTAAQKSLIQLPFL